MTKINSLEFRNALGQFPTGVTIVTALDSNGGKIGMTVSSFNSVSLTPPLVLWSIDKRNFSFDAFNQADHFAIHVLSSQQERLSTKFAQRGLDKFADIPTSEGLFGLPILPDYAACFQCSAESRHDAGDHVIQVGRVLDFVSHQKEPLVFHKGQYAAIA